MYMSYSSKKNKTIVFSEDIIKELAEEFGIEEKYIEDVLDTNINYLKHSLKTKEDVVLVNFPNLGKLALNYYLALSSKFLKRNKIDEKVEVLKKILSENGNNLKNFRRPLIYKFGKKLQSDIFNRLNVIDSFVRIWSDINIKYDEKINK